MVDSITIHYADWSYLQLMNFVDLKYYDHLKLVPRSLMSSSEFITKVLWTILRDIGKTHFSQINREFEKATGNLISDYFEFKDDEMLTFLKQKKHLFITDEKGYAKAKLDLEEQAQYNDQMNNRKKLGNGAH